MRDTAAAFNWFTFACCSLQISAARKFSVSGSGAGSVGETHRERLPGQSSNGKDLRHSVSAAIYMLQPNLDPLRAETLKCF